MCACQAAEWARSVEAAPLLAEPAAAAAAAVWAELGPPLPLDAVAFLAQSGSAMYGLATAASDRDYAVVYQESTLRLLVPRCTDAGLREQPTRYGKHGDQGFATDKQGVVEFSARELGTFLADAVKGFPANVELLFCPAGQVLHASPAWRELVARRRLFLTQRCAAQYLHFFSSSNIQKSNQKCMDLPVARTAHDW